MKKEMLKKEIAKKQNGKCKLSGVDIPENVSLFDTDRIKEKHKGGTYLVNNTRVVIPLEHMKRHGSYRERDVEIDTIKTLMDCREQLRKNVNSLNNRILAVKRRTDNLDKETVEMLNEQLAIANKHLSKKSREVEKYLKKMQNPMVQSALKIKGLGAITIAYMISYVDIEKAESPSSLWLYVGLTKPSHERYEKGVSGGGNKTLRTALYTMADSMIKTRAVYRDVYDNVKYRLEHSEKVVKSRNTQGKLIECMWKETKPCHRHGAAIRKMIKHFLADWYIVHRTLLGLPTRKLYAEEYLNHKTIIKPEERGWEY